MSSSKGDGTWGNSEGLKIRWREKVGAYTRKEAHKAEDRHVWLGGGAHGWRREHGT
jgi:hypothetical protein